jgi:hypothetical protein
VHRPAASLRHAVDAPEELGHDAVGIGAAHERVAVRAVGRDQVVVVAHRARRSDDRRLLADREVQEAADLGLGVHLSRALLEAADEHHRLQPFAGYVALWKGMFGHLVQDVSAGSPPVPRGSTLPQAGDEGCTAGSTAPAVAAIAAHSGS